MSWLATVPLPALVVLFVGGSAVVALGGRFLGHRVFRGAEPSAAAIATPLMPALGAAFAVLAAFAVADAAGGLRDAEAAAGREANAAARVAWASTATQDQGVAIRASLLAYLDATLESEWRDIDGISAGEGAAFDELQALERVIRNTARTEDIGTPQTTELLAGLDGVGGARRSRFTEASPVPAGIVILLALSGVALVLTATVISLGRERRATIVLTGLVLVTGLSLATVVTLGSPFSGSFGASPRPLVDVAGDLRADRFRLEP
ncbi:MAG TPA: hypothetical protein VF855_09780 [Acidimicrobiales bacterium]